MSGSRDRVRRTRAAATGLLAAALVVLSSPIAAAKVSPRSTWTDEVALPGSTVFTSVSCVSTAVCVAVGGGGFQHAVIFRTIDGGASWTRVTPPVDALGLSTVRCASSGYCLAEFYGGGETDDFIVSSDAGVTWTSGGDLTGLTATNLLTCVAPTTCYASIPGVLYVSTDGFVTSARNTEAGYVVQLSCPSTSTCFYATGVSGASLAIHEVSGTGTSVTTVATIPDPRVDVGDDDVSCTSVSVCAATDAGRPSTFASTSDGWTTWTSTRMPSTIGPVAELVCTSSSQCTVSALSPTDATETATTSDGGSTWSTSVLAGSRGPGIDLSCPSGTSCFAVGYGRPRNTIFSAQGTPLRWTAQRLTPISTVLDGVACTSSGRTCVAVGAGGAFFSTDAGASWSRSARAPPASTFIEGVACPMASLCVAVGYYYRAIGSTYAFREIGVTYRTSDGGKGWRILPRATYRYGLTSIACPTSTTCVATILKGSSRVLRTTNDGVTWSATTAPPSGATYTSVSCGSAASCVAVGDTAYFLRSSDGGRSWSIVHARGGAYAVSCVTTRRCWAIVAVGSNTSGEALAATIGTVDGGAAWVQHGGAYPANGASLTCTLTLCVESTYDGGVLSQPLQSSQLFALLDGGSHRRLLALPEAATLELALAHVAGTSRFLAVGESNLNGSLIISSS